MYRFINIHQNKHNKPFFISLSIFIRVLR